MTLPYLYREPHMLPGFIKTYRDGLVRNGHDPMAKEILGKFHIYVSSSLDKAVEEAGPYITSYYKGGRSRAQGNGVVDAAGYQNAARAGIRHRRRPQTGGQLDP